MGLTMDVTRLQEVYVFSLTGQLDAYTSPELRLDHTVIASLGGRRIVIDLASICPGPKDETGIDSVGLGTLVGCYKRSLENGGNMVIVCTNPQIQKAIDITGLSRIIDIHPTLQKAIAALAPPAF